MTIADIVADYNAGRKTAARRKQFLKDLRYYRQFQNPAQTYKALISANKMVYKRKRYMKRTPTQFRKRFKLIQNGTTRTSGYYGRYKPYGRSSTAEKNFMMLIFK